MTKRLLPLLAAVVVALLAAGSGATGKTAAPPAESSPDLWATVNVCDTTGHPDTIGIRGSMPGLGDLRSSLRMRFRVQYKAPDGRWRDAGSTADSGWQNVGRSVSERREGGQNFEFDPPAGETLTLRGAVRFKWVRKHKVVQRARRVTELGHDSTAGADPPGYTASFCEIS